jgi:hypothetical protein
MATKQQQDLFDVLKSSGIRKKAARGLSRSAGKPDAKRSRELSSAAGQLRRAAATIDAHAVDPDRSQAAKKAAQTRKRNAAKRSEAAKRGARTRALSRSRSK